MHYMLSIFSLFGDEEPVIFYFRHVDVDLERKIK